MDRPGGAFALSWASRREADRYEHGRPDYPEQGVRILTAALGLQPGSVVADIAAGTGKLTRSLVGTGATVLGVEPAEGMRQVLASSSPKVTVVGATAESLPLASGSIDAITVAQAIHWFDLDLALAEFRRVLRRGGRLAVVTNRRDETVNWASRLREIITRYEHLAQRPPETRRWQDRLLQSPHFEQWETVEVAHEHRVGSPDQFDARFGSMSVAINLPPSARTRMLDELRSCVPTTDNLVIPQRTQIRVGRRTG
jgi:SAM-dependent methyltransferase